MQEIQFTLIPSGREQLLCLHNAGLNITLKNFWKKKKKRLDLGGEKSLLIRSNDICIIPFSYLVIYREMEKSTWREMCMCSKWGKKKLWDLWPDSFVLFPNQEVSLASALMLFWNITMLTAASSAFGDSLGFHVSSAI